MRLEDSSYLITRRQKAQELQSLSPVISNPTQVASAEGMSDLGGI